VESLIWAPPRDDHVDSLDVARGNAPSLTPKAPYVWPHRIALLVGVLLPLALLARDAANGVLAFDGGMNLQVSASIANGHGFGWDYGGHVVSPRLVQSSGLFVLLGALAIKLFGTGPLAIQVTNLVFLGALLAAVSRVLRPWRTLAVVGPLLFVLLTPGLIRYGLNGYGEGAVGFLMLAAFTLVSSAAQGARRPLLCCASASALIGVSLSIKTITVAELPVLLLGFVLVAACRPEVSRLGLAAAAAVGALPVLAFEAYRAAAFGSLSSWAHYWSGQLGGIRTEAAAPEFVRPGMANAAKGWPRLGSLGDQIGIRAWPLLILFLVAPVAAVAISYLRRTVSAHDWLAQPRRPLEVLLAMLVALYLPWYVLLSPVDWMRHIEIGLMALSMLYLLLLARLPAAYRAFRENKRRSPLANHARARVAAAGVLVAVLAACCGAAASTNVDGLVTPPNHSAAVAERALAVDVQRLADRGASMCGIGDVFAPVVSLTAHIPFCDLDSLRPCRSTATEHDIELGRVYVVWGLQAGLHYPDGPQRTALYRFTRVAWRPQYGSIWRVELQAGACR
jgi:hypothetical protein